jgi:hypothetical protein
MTQDAQGLGGLVEFAPRVEPMLVLGTAVFWIAIAVNVAFAIGIAVHARGRRTLLVPRWIWMLSALVTGPLTALVYWIVHVSPPAGAAKTPV